MDYKLFKISENYLQILNEIEDNEGELTEELSDKLKISNEDLEDQIVQRCTILNGLESDINTVDKEILRLTEYRNRKQKLHNNINTSILQALILFGKEDKNGIKRFEYDTFKLSTRKSKSIEILDKDSVPDKYKKVDISISSLTIAQNTALKLVLSTIDNKLITEFMDKIKEDIKVVKADLKPDVEEQQSQKKIDLDYLEHRFKVGDITGNDYNEGVELIENKYPLLKSAYQETNVSLVIK